MTREEAGIRQVLRRCLSIKIEGKNVKGRSASQCYLHGFASKAEQLLSQK